MKIKLYEEKRVLIKGKEKIFKYSKARIPKENGKFREIYIPFKGYAEQLKSYLPDLSQLLKQNDTLKLNHAFVNNRNCVTNALKHIGYNYCLSFDIKDFFDHIKREHLEHLVNSEILDIALIDDSPRQGLPTSPILSNLAFLKIDEEIYDTILELDDVVYTRYADDLCFSFNDINIKKILNRKIKKIISTYQFEINDKKTKFQSRKNGNIIITGISTTQTQIRPTRKTLKKIRAAKHNLIHIDTKNKEEILRQERVINGLKEWAKCKTPKKYVIKNREVFIRENLSTIDSISINQINIILDLIKNKYINKNNLIDSQYPSSIPKKFIDMEISRLRNKKIISYDKNGNYQLNPNILLEIKIKKL